MTKTTLTVVSTAIQVEEKDCLRPNRQLSRPLRRGYGAFLHPRGIAQSHRLILGALRPGLTQSRSRDNDASATVPPNYIQFSAVYIITNIHRIEKCC